MPVRHGMTIGELARMFNAEEQLSAKLHVVAMRYYGRREWFDQTGQRWGGPSPNLHRTDHRAGPPLSRKAQSRHDAAHHRLPSVLEGLKSGREPADISRE